MKVKESNKQPDFVGNIISGSRLKGPGVMGEVKGEDRKDDIHPWLLDMNKTWVNPSARIDKAV